MSATGTFLASTLVSLACIPLSLWQGHRLAGVVEEIRPRTSEGATLADAPEIPRAYIAQSLEIAYGFPAAVLTTVAFGDLFEWSGLTGIVLLGVTLLVTLFLVWLVSPSKVGSFMKLRPLGLSVVTWVVVVSNMAGLLLSLNPETVEGIKTSLPS